jgi:hypothetical protein
VNVPHAARCELRWAAVVGLPLAMLTLGWMSVAIVSDLVRDAGWVRPLGLVFDGIAWFTIVLFLPVLVGVGVLIARAWIGGRGFASRAQRLRWHLVATTLGTLSLVGVLLQQEPPSLRVLAGCVVVAGPVWLVLFPALYWPRLAWQGLGGIEPPQAPSP